MESLVNDNIRSIEKALLNLFNKEEDSTASSLTEEEDYAQKSFEKGIIRLANGKQSVDPLWRANRKELRNNYYIALGQYRSLQRSLDKDAEKRKLYTEVINKMIENNEIEEVIEQPNMSKDMSRYMNYLPKHEVIKPEPLSTKS